MSAKRNLQEMRMMRKISQANIEAAINEEAMDFDGDMEELFEKNKPPNFDDLEESDSNSIE